MSDSVTAAPADPAAGRAFSAFEWMMALRYLRAKKTEGFVSVISIISLVGIALGVAVLIIVMAVMNGFRHELLSRILGVQGHAVVQGIGGGIADYDRITANVLKVPGVTRATPIIDAQLVASANSANSGVLVRGIRAADLKKFDLVANSLTPGALNGFDGGESVVIGAGLARALGLEVGSQITLMSLQGDVTPFGTTPRIKAYRVAGIFKMGMSEYDKMYIFMPLGEAQMFFNVGDAVSGIEILTTNADAIDAMVPELNRAVAPYARVSTWHDRDSTFFDAVEIERNVMFLILTLIILVAALNIVSGLYMLVKDKSADIAILRTMGASRGAILRIFLIAGLSIGVIGTLIGVLIGVAFCANIEAIRQGLSALTGTTLFNPEVYFLSKMPAEMDFSEVVAVVAMSLSLTFLATIYPSWRAAKLDPVEALRYE